MSFFEPAPGEVLFEAEVVLDSHLRAPQIPPSPILDGPQSADSPDRALQLTGQTLVEIVRAYAFVLSGTRTLREVHGEEVDLADEATGRRLRVSECVDRGLAHNHFDDRVREFLWGLTRQGVGAVSLTSGGRLQRAQIHHMVIASDHVVDFVRGEQLTPPVDRLALGSDEVTTG